MNGGKKKLKNYPILFKDDLGNFKLSLIDDSNMHTG